MIDLFVYGTLQNPEIVQAITGRVFDMTPATLVDHEIKSVRDEHYPGMIKSMGPKAAGQILHNIDPESFKLIQEWEGSDYQLSEVTIELTNRKLEAQTFLWNDPDLLDGPWSNSIYRKGHMTECIAYCIPMALGR